MTAEAQTRIWVGLLLLFAGAAINHFWGKYRNRLRKLRWSAWHTKIAVAAEDPYFGKVEVTYDGNKIANVHTTYIRLVNGSNADLKDVVVSIAYLDGSRIYRGRGLLEGGLQNFPFSDDFSNAIKRAQPDDPKYIWTHRGFRIPVFNRYAQANFYLLVGRDDAATPVVTVGCQYVGARLVFEQQPAMLLGVPIAQASGAGIFATFLLTVWVVLRLSSAWKVGLAAWLLGSCSTVVGAALLGFWKWLGRQFE